MSESFKRVEGVYPGSEAICMAPGMMYMSVKEAKKVAEFPLDFRAVKQGFYYSNDVFAVRKCNKIALEYYSSLGQVDRRNVECVGGFVYYSAKDDIVKYILRFLP